MTTRTKTEVKCPCGHVGVIVMAENDAPFSTQYEQYSLQGLKGTGYYIQGVATWPEVFTTCVPQCPVCDTLLTPDHLVD